MKPKRFLAKTFHLLFVFLIASFSFCASASAVGTQDVTELNYNGINYGNIILTGYLSEGKTTFSIEGDTLNWSYVNVEKGSTCTIKPSDFGGYLQVTLDSYIPTNGVYQINQRDDWSCTQILADGQASVGWGYWPYEGEYQLYFPSLEHPAFFVFGENKGTTPIYGDSYSYNLYADGTMYVLRCDIYDETGNFVIRFNTPYFLKENESTANSSTKFTDVKSTDYFAQSVKWAVENNVTKGTGANTFSPNQTCSTEQILTFLWRANGSPAPTISNPFQNVSADNYYASAVIWAYEKGLISGKTFGAGTPCTRSMAVTYLWKLAGSPVASNSPFNDVPNSASYAQSVAWAVKEGITGGTSKTTFSPNTTCTRGQIVTFLYRNFVK